VLPLGVMDALTLPSRVSAVTVFRRGALVTRTATLLRHGAGLPSAVRIEGLPLSVEDESMQLELVPQGAGAVPLAGDLRVMLAVPEPDVALGPPTHAELEAAALDLALAQQEQADLDHLGDALTTLAPAARGQPEDGQAPMPSPTAARLALLALRRERLERLIPRLHDAAERVRLCSERLETLRERERGASQAKNPRAFEARKAVVVGLQPTSSEAPAERIELRLRYLVPGARWAPSYVLRLDPTLGAGTLELRALVGQATGERWSNVALTLSTANPQQWTELPELRALRIGRRQPPPPKTGWRPPPPGTDLLFADYDRVRPPPADAVASLARPADPSASTRTGGRTEAGTFDAAAMAHLLEDAEEIAEEASRMFSLPPQAAPELAKRSPASAPPPAGAPAPRSSSTMPPPMPMAPAAAMARSGGLGGMIGGAIDGLLGGGGSAYEPVPPSGRMEPAPSQAPAALVAEREQLAYGALWLPPADHPRRGTLVRLGPRERYGQLPGLPPAQLADALAHGHTAHEQALALDHRAPPAGHAWAEGTEGFDYAYEAQVHVDVDSDGELHGLPLRACAVEATPRYVCVPRETQDVFRVVALRNPLDAPLLPGPVDVYVGGRFALASSVEVTPPRGRVELGLGVEPSIKIARNARFEEEASGLLKRSLELEHQLRVEVRNHLERPATVEVRERLPVTREAESDIEVVERSVDPPWDDLRQDTPPLEGGRAWKVEVPAGGERTLRATYAIRIPQSHEIVGGNRREG
jgi:hypothetical protein